LEEILGKDGENRCKEMSLTKSCPVKQLATRLLGRDLADSTRLLDRMICCTEHEFALPFDLQDILVNLDYIFAASSTDLIILFLNNLLGQAWSSCCFRESLGRNYG
jgi:hypothetical protein